MSAITFFASGPMGMTLCFGRFLLNPRERTLLCEGTLLPVTAKELDTLILLVENAGHLMTKSEMIARIWPDSFVSESSLTRNISVLRKLLGAEWIETVPKKGYRFRDEVVKVAERQSSVQTAAEAGIPRQNPSRPVRSMVRFSKTLWVAAGLLVALATLLYDEFR